MGTTPVVMREYVDIEGSGPGEKRCSRWAARRSRSTVRILAATNAGLEKRIREGSFRSDLFYRLAGYVLRVPPLRERREDLPLLVEHFLRTAARDAGKSVRRNASSSDPGRAEIAFRMLPGLCAVSCTVRGTCAPAWARTAFPASG